MIDLALVHFRAVDLRYLEAALYSVLHQRRLPELVKRILILDNDTDTPAGELEQLVLSYVEAHWSHLGPRVPVQVVSLKHGEEQKRSQSWSVNEVFRQLPDADWVFFTRSDYILDFHAVEKFGAVVEAKEAHRSYFNDYRGFITSYAYHMAYDARGDQRIEGMRDIEPTGWRMAGPQVLLDAVNGWKVDSSDKDAGVWLTRRRLWEAVGGLNENLVAWGFQQTAFQQALFEAGVDMVQIPEFLFFHQHHGGNFRDYDKGIAELEAHWGPREKMRTFRDISMHVGKVCDELDKK